MYFHTYFSCSLRITFCFHEAENFKFVRIFNNIQIFKSHLPSSKLFGSLQAQHNSASYQTFFLLVTLDFLRGVDFLPFAGIFSLVASTIEYRRITSIGVKGC